MREVLGQYRAIAVFRSRVISRSVGVSPDNEAISYAAAAGAAFAAGRVVGVDDAPDGYAIYVATRVAANTANAVAYAAANAYVATYAVAAKAAAAAADAVEAFNGGVDTMWEAIEADCKEWGEGKKTVFQPLVRPLWLTPRPRWFEDALGEAYALWNRERSSWSRWDDWYVRRLEGQPNEWPLPPEQDREMARRLLEADEDFWKRGEEDPAFVNAQIGAWLEELAPKIGESDFDQNPQVPRFDDAPDGHIGLASQHLEAIGPDADGFDRRHALTRKTLIAALDASAPSKTQAVEIAETLRDLIEALSASPQTIQPESYVVFSKALRREMKDHLSPETSKPPLAEGQIEALERWMDADAIMLALHDQLAQAEKAVYERRFAPVAIEREALAGLIDGIRQSGLPAPEADRVLAASIEAIPAGASTESPDLRVAEQIAENFIRRVGRKVWNGVKATGSFGAKAWKPAAAFFDWMAAHGAALKSQFPALASVIDFIIKWTSKP